jgi:hypothetical protein
MINNILKMIKAAMDAGDLKAWAQGHANLIKAIGERPVDIVDPTILQQHNYYMTIVLDGNTSKIKLEDFLKLPVHHRTKLAKQLENDIDEETAFEIMNS